MSYQSLRSTGLPCKSNEDLDIESWLLTKLSMCLVIIQSAISFNIYSLVILEVPHLNFSRNCIVKESPMAACLKLSPQTVFLENVILLPSLFIIKQFQLT